MVDIKKRWYVLQTSPSCESYVVQILQQRIKQHQLENKFGTIFVPTEEVVEIRPGKKRQKRHTERKFFPNYIFIEMEMDEESWHLVRGVPKASGFIGGDKPTPLSAAEMDKIINKVQQSNPQPKIIFNPGELLRIKAGSFADFNGVVEEVDYDKNRLKVSVSIFGRATPVELDFNEVEKC